MGVYGTYGAFNGLGKPSIKLEFEDNEALLDFQRRMQEGGDGNDDPDGGNFTPSTYTQEQLDNAVKNHTVTGWGIFPEIPDGWQLVKTSAAPKGFNVITKGEPSFEMTTEGWKFKHSLDAALIEKKKGLKVVKDDEEPVEGTTDDEETRKYNFYLMLTSDIETIQSKKFSPQLLNDFEENDRDYRINTPIGEVIIKKGLIYGADRHLFKHIYYYFNVLQKTLEDPVCIFTSTDDKGVKNKTFIKCFYLDGVELMSIVSPVTPNELVLKTTYKPNGYNQVWELFKRGGEDIIYLKPSINDLHGLGNPRIITPSFNVVEFRLPVIITKNGAKSFVDSVKNSLEGYGDFYTVRDMRKRSRKEPGDVAANKNLQFTKDNDRKINNFDRSLYESTNGVNSWNYGEKLKDTHWRTLTVKYNSDNGKYFTTITLFFPYTLRRDLDKPTFTGYASGVDVDVDLNNLYNYSYYIDSRNYVDRQRLEGFVKDDYYKTLLIEAIKSGYKQLQQRLINTKNSRLANSPSNIAEAERLIKYYKMLYSDPSKYDLLDKAYGGGFKNISTKLEKFLGEGGLALDDLGKTANDALYNNLEILDFRGMQPTYRQLSNYDAFFKPATNKNSLKGWGLNDTKKLIADICRNHYKECAAIAKHLKAETKLQSAFNLWHWLHHNIRYEYDREGREEVRTPSRTWADRHRGVDCDCLSVFAWCVLKCMGYNPAFELAAFRNKPAYSHIYINLDGIVVDRVWYVFNSRPPFITKTELFKVGMLDNLGQLF